MTALTADHIARRFGSLDVLRDVSLSVDLGEKIGLVGVNGSGKSTLGRILAGVDTADMGVVARRRDLTFAYLCQEPVLDPGRTAYQEVESALGAWHAATRRYEQLSEIISVARDEAPGMDAWVDEQTTLALEIEELGGWDTGHKVHAMLARLGVRNVHQRVAELSGGERRRVALAKVLLSAPDFAVLDEPTNHLDADTAEWLEGYLRDEFTGALVLITHDRYFLDRVVTRIAELDRGELVVYPGSYGAYLEARAERLEHEARTEARRENLLRREREWLARGPKARATKQKARIQRAEELGETVIAARRKEHTATIQAAAVRSGRTVLEFHGVSKRFGARELFAGLNLYLCPGDRMGVIGPNGVGKTTLVRMVLGEESPTEGEVRLGKNTRVAYFDQGRSGLRDDLSVYDNLYEGSDKVRLGERWLNLRSYLEGFLFDGAKQRQLVGSLSGGERARVALARMLRGDSNLLILDEPTNDLDIATLGVLEEMLVEWPGTAIMVSHDRYFLNRVATSILAFEPHGRVVHQAGDYDTWRALREDTLRVDAERESARSTAPDASRRATLRPGPDVKPLTLAETRELEELPGRIDEADAALQALERRLNDPMFYAASASEVSSTVTAAEETRRRVEGWMARWEALEARRVGRT